MSTPAPPVGVVGLGRMGAGIARRLLDAGHPVTATSRTRARAEDLLAAGVRWSDTPRGVAEAAAVVLTSLPDDEAVLGVADGPDGLLAGLGAGAAWVEMSTIRPPTSRALAGRAAERGGALLDAPVSGGPRQVASGTLTIMVGGDDDAYRRVEPVLRELGTPTHVGGHGQGLVLKLAINVSLAVQMLAFAEGLLLATRSGIDRDRALRVMTSSAIASPLLTARAPLVFQLPEQAMFTLEFMRKDVDLALEVAEALEVPLPTAERAAEVLRRAGDLGFDQRDLAALYEVLDRMRTAGLTVA
jgi:3-hydroxyisobutyrate dehydrogenase-like beta-hydroxyacid dehydrogenase